VIRKLTIAFAAAVLAVALLAPLAKAAPITLGSSLTGTFATSKCGTPCTIFNLKVGGSNPVASPVDGVIVRWRITGGSPIPGYAIRVLRPTGTTYTAVGTSTAQTPVGGGLEVFPSLVPIKAGDLVGIDTPNGGALPIADVAGASYGGWAPPLGEGASGPFVGPVPNRELAYNADVQPRPSVSLLSPASGTFKGGTAVTIAGADFASVSSVRFGAVPAPFFSVDSEGVVRAVAPPAARRGPVQVTVTTIAGTSVESSSSQYTYAACVVPKLKGKSVATDRKALKKAGCKLGKVNRPKGLGKGAKVVKQTVKAGTVLPPNAKVGVKLG
jgi:IPT/TIG domain/PASTA domain